MESALLPGGGVGEIKMQTNKKIIKEEKEKKAKKTWGLVLYPFTPPPQKTQSNVKLPRFGCFWAFCGLPVFSRRLTLPRLWGDSRSGSFPVHLAGWRRPEKLPGPRERSPALPWRRGPGGSGAEGRLAQCAWVGAGADWEL